MAAISERKSSNSDGLPTRPAPRVVHHRRRPRPRPATGRALPTHALRGAVRLGATTGLGALHRFPADQQARLVGGKGFLAHRLECDDPVERAEQLADVVDVEAGDGLQHPVAEGGASLLRLPSQDGDPRLVVRCGHVDDEAAREAADQPLIERLDVGGRPIAGQHDLAARRLQRVGQAEELGLHLAPVGEELDVVHQQEIHVEESLPVRLAVPGGDGGVKRLDELIEREVLDREARVDRPGRMPDGHQQVRLAQARPRVHEQRVVHRPRRFRDGLGGGDREPVGRPDHERVEPVEGIERDRHATGLPTASRLSTSSEMPRSVSKTPAPWSASAA